MAGSHLEDIPEGNRAQRRRSARAAAFNREAVRVNQPLLGQVFCRVYAIVHVYHAPLSVKALAVSPAITRTAAIIYVHNRDTSAGPELDFQIKIFGAKPGRAAVTLDQQRRQLARRSREIL